MTDQNSQFFAILTAVGEAKQANANALGVPWTFAQMGVGDANNTDPVPSRTQTKLINERRRAPLNQITVDPANSSIIIAEQVIPPDVGGWWIREIGLYDAAGDLVAVANCAPSFKPLLSQGTGKTQVVRLNIVVTSTANVQLKIDPAVVLATREYVDNKTFDSLKEKPVTLAGYGINDAYTKSEINIFLGGKAAKASTLAAYGITDAYNQSEINLFLSGKAAKATTLAGYGITDVYNSTAVDDALANKANKATTLSGYGITDVYSQSEINLFLSGKAAKATTLVGYGITDAYSSTAVDDALANKANKATTLAGYGIVLPSQAEAEATDSIDNTKPMTALRVAQSIAKRLLQAGESIVGVSRFATLAEVVAGAAGHLAVCPSYLVAGIGYSFDSNGYIKLPTWLGGLMLQWSLSEESLGEADYRYFPVAFPSVVYGAWLQLNSSTTSGFAGSYGTILSVVDVNRYVWTAGGNWGGGGKGWILALGR